MSDDPEDTETAALRLENALERIAQAMAQSIAAAPPGAANETPDTIAAKARLDALIARLRAGLNAKPA